MSNTTTCPPNKGLLFCRCGINPVSVVALCATTFFFSIFHFLLSTLPYQMILKENRARRYCHIFPDHCYDIEKDRQNTTKLE